VGVYIDGTYIWVVNYSDHSVTKLLASDGTLAGTFQSGFGPYHIVSNGKYICITTTSGIELMGRGQGILHHTYLEGRNLVGLAFDGANL
jgi:hypothetical protein